MMYNLVCIELFLQFNALRIVMQFGILSGFQYTFCSVRLQLNILNREFYTAITYLCQRHARTFYSRIRIDNKRIVSSVSLGRPFYCDRCWSMVYSIEGAKASFSAPGFITQSLNFNEA